MGETSLHELAQLCCQESREYKLLRLNFSRMYQRNKHECILTLLRRRRTNPIQGPTAPITVEACGETRNELG